MGQTARTVERQADCRGADCAAQIGWRVAAGGVRSVAFGRCGIQRESARARQLNTFATAHPLACLCGGKNLAGAEGFEKSPGPSKNSLQICSGNSAKLLRRE